MTEANLGILIDSLYATRQQRLDITKQVDALKSMEVELRGQILGILESTGLAKASGQMATCGITTKVEPIVTDWDAVHSWIRINNRFDLLQKRISAPAWRDLQADDTLVPGTEPTVVTDLSLTKSTRG